MRSPVQYLVVSSTARQSEHATFILLAKISHGEHKVWAGFMSIFPASLS